MEIHDKTVEQVVRIKRKHEDLLQLGIFGKLHKVFCPITLRNDSGFAIGSAYEGLRRGWGLEDVCRSRVCFREKQVRSKLAGRRWCVCVSLLAARRAATEES